MATKIDQKAYLQKYLTGKSADKKKKKKKVSKGTGFKIIDDDIDLTKLRTLEGDELDILDNGEDAPQIAGIIDERPEDVRKMEQYNVNSKWRVINQDDGFNSKLQIQEIQKDVKEQVKENELIFGKMYSDSEDETEKKKDSDASPPRKQSNSNQKPRTSKKPQNNSDSDFSPPRQKDDRKNSNKSDRTRKRESSPPKRQDDKRSKEKHSKNYDSDLSPPRKQDLERKKEISRKASRWGDFEQEKKEYMSKASTSRNWSDSDASPPRKSTKNYDSDQSPPRKSKKASPSRQKRLKSPDSDMSPPRKRKQSPEKPQRRRKKSTDSDMSPPRKNRKESRRKSPDSDLSPPRKSRVSPSRNSRFRNGDRNDSSPPPSNRKMAKTLEGKAAGLQSATRLREENDAFRRKEDEAFSQLADEVSGRNAKVANKRAGKRESSAERVIQKEKAERQKELDEKYKKWSKGLKQVEATEARHQDFLHESSKPLARLAGDADLEAALRGAERPDDPMLQYVRRSRRERGDLPPEKPAYKGSFPPNRFNIRPGYRWDGVDRSSGYERKYFETQSKRKAQEEEYFKWSSADM